MDRLDDDVAEVALAVLAESGVGVVNDATVTSMADVDGAPVRVSYTAGGREETMEADAVLVATGRRPWTEGLDLAAGGVDVDEKGWIAVDDRLRTSADRVGAVGDVNGGPEFTYISLDDYRIVLSQLQRGAQRSRADRVAVPNCAFLTPPLATVGLTEKEARASHASVKVARRMVAEIAAMPRPKIEKDPRGVVKVVVDGESDQILGAALMHVHADEVISLVALVMRAGVTATELQDGIWTHRSSTEGLNEVLGALQ